MRFLKNAPSSAIALLGIAGEAYQFTVTQRLVAKAILTDPRMIDAWTKLERIVPARGWSVFGDRYPGVARGESYFLDVLWIYQLATHPESWELKTRVDQHKWIDKLDKLVDEIALHIESGPMFKFDPPTLGSFIPSELVRKHKNLPPEALKIDWSLVESMRYYAERKRIFSGNNQWMKRPCHAKADRERFIFMLFQQCANYYGHSMREVIAITACVVFNDESITPRLVRRITSENSSR